MGPVDEDVKPLDEKSCDFATDIYYQMIVIRSNKEGHELYLNNNMEFAQVKKSKDIKNDNAIFMFN